MPRAWSTPPTPAATRSRPGRSTARWWRRSASSAMAKPEDFVGCCNPVNLAVAPDGCIVTAEKVARPREGLRPGPRAAGGHRPRALRSDVHATSTSRSTPAGGSSRRIPNAATIDDLRTVMSETSTRRQFIDTTCRVVGLTALGGAAAPSWRTGASAHAVFQVDPLKCAACDLCRTSCVLSLSAVKAVNEFSKCGYCLLCPAYMDVTSQPDEKGMPSGKVCPQDALKRRVVGKEDLDDPNNNYYEYTRRRAAVHRLREVRQGLQAADRQRLAAPRDPLRPLRDVQRVLDPHRLSRGGDRARADAGPVARLPAASGETADDVLDADPCARRRVRGPAWPLLLLLVAFASSALLAQYQKAPPDFGGSLLVPDADPPRAALGHRPRHRRRHARGRPRPRRLPRAGAAQPHRGDRRSASPPSPTSGSTGRAARARSAPIQNVTLSLVDPRYLISLGVLAFFFLPLVAAFLFGRVFCGGVCPLGAVQDLVLLKPKAVPGEARPLAAVARRSSISRRRSSSPAGASRPSARRASCCRAGGSSSASGTRSSASSGVSGLVPHAGHRRRLHRRRHVLRPAVLPLAVPLRRPAVARCRGSPGRTCASRPTRSSTAGCARDACPYGAIHDFRADRATCVSCARCYECCPREVDGCARGASRRSQTVRRTAPGRGRAHDGGRLGLRAFLGRPGGRRDRALLGGVADRRVRSTRCGSLRPRRRWSSPSRSGRAPTPTVHQTAPAARVRPAARRAAATRTVYRWGGLLLLFSLGVFVAWIQWRSPARAMLGSPQVPCASKRKAKKAVRPRSAEEQGRRPLAAGRRDRSGTCPGRILVGVGSCGIASGALDVAAAIDASVAAMGGGAAVKWVGCSGFCHHEPLVEVVENGVGRSMGASGPETSGSWCDGTSGHAASSAGSARASRTSRARLLDDAAWARSRPGGRPTSLAGQAGAHRPRELR